MSETLENEIRTLRAHFWSERDPEGRAFAPLADAYLRKGDLEEAHALLEDGLGRLPEFVSGHLVAARVHRARGDQGALRETVDRLLELDGENAAGLRLHGEILEEEGRSDEARECFRRALSLNPEYDDLESRIARLEVGGIPDDSGEADGFAAGAPVADPTALEEPLETLHFESSDDLTVDDVPDPEPEPAGIGDPFELAWEGGGEAGLDSSGDDAEPEPAGEDDDLSPTVTRTLGELYLRQGLTGRAVEVFEELVRRRPDDLELRERLKELRERLSEPDDGEAGEASAVGAEADEAPQAEAEEDEASEVEAEVGEAPEAEASEVPEAEADEVPEAEAVTGEALEVEEEEVLYGSETRSQADDADLVTPFAWGEAVGEEGERESDDGAGGTGIAGPAEGPDEAPASPVPGRTIGRYLGDLLAWEPGAIPIEALDPAAVPIASLAPEAKPAPTPSPEDSGDAGNHDDADGEGDLDDFQDWLRGLRS